MPKSLLRIVAVLLVASLGTGPRSYDLRKRASTASTHCGAVPTDEYNASLGQALSPVPINSSHSLLKEPPYVGRLVFSKDKTLVAEGKQIWEWMRQGDPLKHLTSRETEDNAPFDFGQRLIWDGLEISWPFKGVVPHDPA